MIGAGAVSKGGWGGGVPGWSGGQLFALVLLRYLRDNGHCSGVDDGSSDPPPQPGGEGSNAAEEEAPGGTPSPKPAAGDESDGSDICIETASDSDIGELETAAAQEAMDAVRLPFVCACVFFFWGWGVGCESFVGPGTWEGGRRCQTNSMAMHACALFVPGYLRRRHRQRLGGGVLHVGQRRVDLGWVTGERPGRLQRRGRRRRWRRRRRGGQLHQGARVHRAGGGGPSGRD